MGLYTGILHVLDLISFSEISKKKNSICHQINEISVIKKTNNVIRVIMNNHN